MAMAAIVMMTDPEVNAGSNAADMRPDADIGSCRRRAQQAQGKN